MKTILVPVDFSGITAAVADRAFALARAFKGRVVLLTVTEPPVITGDYALMMENYAAITVAAEATAARELAHLQARLARKGLVAKTLALTGNPSLLIAEQAAQLRADCVVMGSHGHTAFYDLLIGSTTQGVLKRVRCPVLIVPPPQAKKRRAKK